MTARAYTVGLLGASDASDRAELRAAPDVEMVMRTCGVEAEEENSGKRTNNPIL